MNSAHTWAMGGRWYPDEDTRVVPPQFGGHEGRWGNGLCRSSDTVSSPTALPQVGAHVHGLRFRVEDQSQSEVAVERRVSAADRLTDIP
jgi:hypothetical protein